MRGGYGLELLQMGLGRRDWGMGIRLHVSRAVGESVCVRQWSMRGRMRGREDERAGG
jgi:hypothetical protein